MQRHGYLLCLLLLLSGLGLRAALGQIRTGDLTADNDGYLALSGPVSQGHGLRHPYGDRPTAFRPPAYPMVLGALRAAGLDDRNAVLLTGLLSSAVLGLFTWKLARQLQLDVNSAALATGAVMLDPLLLRYSVLPMTEVPCAAVLLAAVCWFREARERSSGSATSAVLSGLMFGAGILVRPVVLVTCVLLTLRGLADCVRRRSTAIVLIPAIIAGVVLLPWVIRNFAVYHRFIPATTHGGYTLALGNNPDFYRDVIRGEDKFPWDGTALDAWQKRMSLQSIAENVPQTDEPALDAFYYRVAVDAIRADPDSFGRACLLRLRRFWAVTAAESSFGAATAVLTGLWYSIVWVGVGFERVHAWKVRKTEHSSGHADLWLVILSFMLMHTVYWTDARMRAPVMPFLIVLSVFGWRLVFRSLAVRCFGARRFGAR